MKLFQKLLVAPAAIGLLAPVAASASDLNLDGMNAYSRESDQVTSIQQLGDVQPTDWAYQALSNLIERYGCVAGYPDGTYRGGRAMTRFEAAALLNACLDRVTEISDELRRLITEFEKELAILRGRVDGLEAKVGELEASQFSTTTKLNGKATFVIGANDFSGDGRPNGYEKPEDFDDEVANIYNEVYEQYGVDGIADLADALDKEIIIEDFLDQAETDSGATITDEEREYLQDVLSDGIDDDFTFDDLATAYKDAPSSVQDVLRSSLISSATGVPIGERYSDWADRVQGATVFNYDLKINLDTSFTGKDLLRTRLRSGNFSESSFGGPVVGLNALETAYDTDNDIEVDRVFYQFPLGSNFTATIGGRVRQDDMLAMWPSAYPSDTILDFFTYAGSPGAYSLNLGGGGGLSWKGGNWSVSANYVSQNADIGDTTLGGIGTENSAQTGTFQVGYGAPNWGLAATYTYGDGAGGLYSGNGTPFAVDASFLSSSSNNVGVSAYWQPDQSSWVPSISLGWGLSTYNNSDANMDTIYDDVQAQSWYVGLQWSDMLIKGNDLGLAVGQPTFVTSFGDNELSKNIFGDSPDDGNYMWELWYKFQVTDNISVTPAVYYLSQPLGYYGKIGNIDGDDFNNFGGLIKTTFRF